MGLASCTHDVEIIPRCKTDHFEVKLTIVTDNYTRGPGVWKFNSLHLNDNRFMENMKQTLLKSINNSNMLDDMEAWEFIKSQAIEFCRKYAKELAKKTKKQNCLLEKTLDILNTDLISNPDSQHIKEAIDRIEYDICQQKQNKVNSSIFHSKVNWELNGEKPSKYFFALEKRNYLNKNMKAIRNKEGKLCTQQNEILREQTRFYQELYTRNESVHFQFTPDPGEKFLNELDKQELDKDITIEELYSALKGMADKKTPGMDGLTKEFYIAFFDILGKQMLHMYQKCHKEGIFGKSPRTGLLTLIPKKDSDTLKLKSWRPLCMLNLDFKILSKTFAERVKNVLPYLISDEQCGFLKGRSIQENIMRTIEIIHYTRRNRVPAIILQLDFEKCFDKIEHNSIYDSFRYLNFGEGFISWIKLFYNQMVIHTQNFGYISDAFIKQRGTNQGCNFSPFAFLVCGEIMNRKLNANVNIKGIVIEGIKNLISKFADDTTLFLKFDQITLTNEVSFLEKLEKNTGLTINYDKPLCIVLAP